MTNVTISISKLPGIVGVAVAACLGAAACGKADPGMSGTGGTGPGVGGSTGGTSTGTGGGPCESTGDPSQQLLPMKTGNTWTYLVTDSTTGVEAKTQTVMEAGPIGGMGPNAGTTACRFVTRKGTDLKDQTISWQARVGTRVVRYREQAYAAMAPYALELEEYWEPYKLRVDESPEHMTAGATWMETDQETKLAVGLAPAKAEVQEQWKVTADRVAVTVLGKSYEVMIVTKTGQPSGTDPAPMKTYWWARGIGKVKEIGFNQTEELMSYQLAP